MEALRYESLENGTVFNIMKIAKTNVQTEFAGRDSVYATEVSYAT